MVEQGNTLSNPYAQRTTVPCDEKIAPVELLGGLAPARSMIWCQHEMEVGNWKFLSKYNITSIQTKNTKNNKQKRTNIARSVKIGSRKLEVRRFTATVGRSEKQSWWSWTTRMCLHASYTVRKRGFSGMRIMLARVFTVRQLHIYTACIFTLQAYYVHPRTYVCMR